MRLSAAMLLGLVVHWRIYPIIYALPIWLFLPSGGESRARRSAAAGGAALQEPGCTGEGAVRSAAADGGAPRLSGSGTKAPESSTGGEGASQKQGPLRMVLDFFSRCEGTLVELRIIWSWF